MLWNKQKKLQFNGEMPIERDAEKERNKIKPQIFYLLFCFQCVCLSVFFLKFIFNSLSFPFCLDGTISFGSVLLWCIVNHCYCYQTLFSFYIKIVCADFNNLQMNEMRKWNPHFIYVVSIFCCCLFEINLQCTVIVTEPKKERKKKKELKTCVCLCIEEKGLSTLIFVFIIEFSLESISLSVSSALGKFLGKKAIKSNKNSLQRPSMKSNVYLMHEFSMVHTFDFLIIRKLTKLYGWIIHCAIASA